MNNNIVIKKILVTLFFFFLAGLCEIGGGYLIWLWLRENMNWILGVVGGSVLFLYGIVPTFQPSHFHRIYAAYGGIFIVMALFWGWIFEAATPAALICNIYVSRLNKLSKNILLSIYLSNIRYVLQPWTLYSNTHLKYCKLHRITERSCRQWNYSRTPIWLN